MKETTLSQIHIEAARNSTDDNNLFHDKNRWNWIENNPFNGPIALGFQLGCLIEDCVKNFRKDSQREPDVDETDYPYSLYELTFAGVIKPGDNLEIDVKGTRASNQDGVSILSNRILLKANKRAVILGFKKDVSEFPFDVPDFPWQPSELRNLPDRSFVDEVSGYFLKRKFMIVGNAKNFLTSALVEQSDYIDEFADKVCFPEMYPLSLVSSALLERARVNSHDLVKYPMIYASHKLCINKKQLLELRSNDCLNILISPEIDIEGDTSEKISHLCIAYSNESEPLFVAQIYLLPLASLLK